MTDHLEPEDIERRLEEDRAALADDIEELKTRFSFETIVRQAADQIREHSDDITASVGRAVKDNPLAVAVTGVGLAWLIFGDRTGQRSRPATRRTETVPVTTRSSGYPSYADRPAERTRQGSMTQDSNLPSWLKTDHDHDYDHADGKDSRKTTDKARAALSQSKDRLAGASESVRERMQDTAGSMRERTAQWRERLSEGTEHLTEEGRARVIAAREKASEARDAAMARMQGGKERAVDLFEDHPLIVGALAVAAGAAMAAALPHTRMEDEQFGETSDALIREAERILSEETEKLGTAMETATDEAGDIAREAAARAGSVVESAAASVSERASKMADDRTGSSQGSDQGSGHGSDQDRQKAGDADKPATGKPRPIGDIPS